MSLGLGRGDFGLSSGSARPRGGGRRTLTEEQRAEVCLRENCTIDYEKTLLYLNSLSSPQAWLQFLDCYTGHSLRLESHRKQAQSNRVALHERTFPAMY